MNFSRIMQTANILFPHLEKKVAERSGSTTPMLLTDHQEQRFNGFVRLIMKLYCCLSVPVCPHFYCLSQMRSETRNSQKPKLDHFFYFGFLIFQLETKNE